MRFRDDCSNAPVFYAKGSTIGKFTDISLALYRGRLSENGNPFRQYTLIFSNEDGGTSTQALLARWGRTTDVEYVYRAFLNVGQHPIRKSKLRQFGAVDGEAVSDPHSSHLGHADFATHPWKRNSAESPEGFVRTTVELPRGTTCRVDAVTKCFFLDREYTPDTNVWSSATPTTFQPAQYGHPR